jgi:predicted ABC-type transport system involved in lysophospholipase L1 biosynthesis ATPase subunit
VAGKGWPLEWAYSLTVDPAEREVVTSAGGVRYRVDAYRLADDKRGEVRAMRSGLALQAGLVIEEVVPLEAVPGWLLGEAVAAWQADAARTLRRVQRVAVIAQLPGTADRPEPCEGC